MFTLFTSSQFGRGLSSNSSETSNLSTYLAAYRRNRAKRASQSPLNLARAA
jgi:hypothetical protein